MSDDAMWTPDAFAEVCTQRDEATARAEAAFAMLRAVLGTIDRKQFSTEQQQWVWQYAEAMLAEVGK
jgi:hypothetical protein